MHVSRVVYMSAFEHIPYSARGSAITHVASARVHTIPLACAQGEHQYVLGIEVKKRTSRFYPHTRILPNMAWSRPHWPPYASRAAWASCWPFFPCREKHHSCSLLRGIYLHAFLMQFSPDHRKLEPTVQHQLAYHMTRCSFPTAVPHVLQFSHRGATRAGLQGARG